MLYSKALCKILQPKQLILHLFLMKRNSLIKYYFATGKYRLHFGDLLKHILLKKSRQVSARVLVMDLYVNSGYTFKPYTIKNVLNQPEIVKQFLIPPLFLKLA